MKTDTEWEEYFKDRPPESLQSEIMWLLEMVKVLELKARKVFDNCTCGCDKCIDEINIDKHGHIQLRGENK